MNKEFSFTISQNGHEIVLPASKIVEMFSQLYYVLKDQTWENSYFLGRHVIKCPLDLWVYQEIFAEHKPDVIIETGTFHGGTALYYASLCDLLDHGHIITIDIDKYSTITEHPRITYLTGSSISDQIVSKVDDLIKDKKNIMVILDSDHTIDHVSRELSIYSEIVSAGSYLIVEDTNINGHPVRPDWGPGPMEAVEDFLEKDDRFVVDKSKEKYLMTLNPNGYLKKIRD